MTGPEEDVDAITRISKEEGQQGQPTRESTETVRRHSQDIAATFYQPAKPQGTGAK